jgi:uncharacterized protein
VRIYLDSSAIVKLVQREAESGALRTFLKRHRDDERITSMLARVEVTRAVLAGGSAAVAHARAELGTIHQIAVDTEVLDRAATLSPDTALRSLDAILVASAQLVGDLRAVVTYDHRMTEAAEALGLPTAAPS